MPTITQINRQDRADQGFRVDRGRGNGLRLAEAAAPLPIIRGTPNLPAVQTIAAMKQNAQKQKLKVAAYCRVSTLLESQEGSIASQRRHYRKQIEENPDWVLAGIYLEAGVSGTKAEIRPELQRLIADCKAGKINLILTKSISRFARNTSDCLEMVRTLTALDVDIHFEKEGIHTGTMESEFMLSILACLAEDESRSISGNMKWGLRKRFQNSTYKMANAPYGYRREGTELIVVPEEAEIVKGIFHAVLSGCGAFTIAEELNSHGIPSPYGIQWNENTIRRMVRNPVYCGDMLYQKTYTDDEYHQRVNRGELDQYYDENHHEAIVSREAFELAGTNMRQRSWECGSYTEEENREKAMRRKNRYALSGRVFCAACGQPMYRVGVGKHPVMRCGSKRNDAANCPNETELEENIKNSFITCLNKLAYAQGLAPKYRVIDAYIEMVSGVEQEKNAARLAEIDTVLKQNKLEQDMLTATAMIDCFRAEHRAKKVALESEETELLKEKLYLATHASTCAQTEKLRSYIAHWTVTNRTEDFPDEAFMELVDKVIVASRESVTFHFYCGFALTESLRRGS